MGNNPIFRTLIFMSLPSMLSMTIQSLYNIVDSYFVGQISENALRAVSIVFPVQQLMIALFVGTAIGVGSYVARSLGAKNFDDADQAVGHGLMLGIINWLIFVVIGITLSGVVAHGFSDIPDVQNMAIDYMQIVTIGSIGVSLSVTVEKTLQATGDMIIPMMLHLLGAITNIILDPILIFGWGFIPAMGIRGAAYATIAGQILGGCTGLFVLLFKEHGVKCHLGKFRPQKFYLYNIMRVSLPSIVMGAVNSILVFSLNGIIKPYSETGITAFGISIKLQSFIMMPIFGLNQGLLPLIGYNYGAHNFHRVRRALLYACLLSLAVSTSGMLVFELFPEQLLRIFNDDPTLISIGIPAIRIIALCYPSAGASIMVSGAFQAMGFGTRSLIISLSRQVFVLLPVAYVLGRISIIGIWCAFPIAEIVSFSLCTFLYLRLRKRYLLEQ